MLLWKSNQTSGAFGLVLDGIQASPVVCCLFLMIPWGWRRKRWGNRWWNRWWLNEIGWLVVCIIWWIFFSMTGEFNIIPTDEVIFLRGVETWNHQWYCGWNVVECGWMWLNVVECGWMWLNVVECPCLMGKNESCSMLSSWRMGIHHVTMKWLLWMVAKSCTTKRMVESLQISGINLPPIYQLVIGISLAHPPQIWWTKTMGFPWVFHGFRVKCPSFLKMFAADECFVSNRVLGNRLKRAPV